MSERNPRRTRNAILATFLLLGTLVAISTPASALMAYWGCRTTTAGGSGDFYSHITGNTDHVSSWIDGCGGQRCDDSVRGTTATGREFQAREYRSGGTCYVICELSGTSPWTTSSADVNPNDASVSFYCSGSPDWRFNFSGSA